MENENSTVSVIVPVFNAEMYIDQTIQSVINQSYKNWQLILIDDGSTDNSVKIIKKYTDAKKIILLQHPEAVNLGVSKSRELGIKFAKGKYIAFLDADDVFYQSKLKNQLAIFSKTKDVILIHSKAEILNNYEKTFNNEFILFNQDKIYELHKQKSWLKDNKICNSTVIVKSEVLKKIQFGLPQLFQFEDWLLWSLIAVKGKFYYQNAPQIKYRIHSTSATATILKNKLITPYSRIEYLISLYLLSKSNSYNIEIIEQLKGTIVSLIELYSNENNDKVHSFRLDINNVKEGEGLYIKKYYELSVKYANLQKEFEASCNKKIPRYYKLMSKIKKIYKSL